MATAEQIKSLLRSYSDTNSDTFLSVALQIAAPKARVRKRTLAPDLKKLFDDNRSKQRIDFLEAVGEIECLLPRKEENAQAD